MIANRLTACQEKRRKGENGSLLAFLVGGVFIIRPLPQADNPLPQRLGPLLDLLLRRLISGRKRMNRDLSAGLGRFRQILRHDDHEMMKGRTGQFRQDIAQIGAEGFPVPPS